MIAKDLNGDSLVDLAILSSVNNSIQADGGNLARNLIAAQVHLGRSGGPRRFEDTPDLYVLPANENCFPHSYLVLEGMIADLSGYEGVVMCSMFMLPERAERRRRLCQRVFEQSCAIHLVVEDMVIAGPQDVDRLEELLAIDRLAAQAPRSFALD